MMRTIKAWLAATAATLLVACGGGGGDAGDPIVGPGDGSGGPTVTSIEVLTSATEVRTGGEPVTISAFVKGAGNNALASVPVTFSTSTGTLTSIVATTDATGLATARFGSGADKSNRNATVTVTAGSRTGTIDVAIRGTSLAYSGPTTLAFNTDADLSIKLTDGQSNPVPGASITVSSSLGNGLTSSTIVTDSQGQGSVRYTATTAGADTITFAGAGVSRTAQITISGEDFAFISPAASATAPVGTPTALQVRYRQSGAPQAGQTVRFAATGGTLSSTTAVTNASGVATVNLTSLSAGPITVEATLTAPATARATLPINIVAVAPHRLVLQVSPSSVAPNRAGATSNQAQVLARVVDIADNPVQGVIVNFRRDVDPSGGNFQQPSAVTDFSGQATVQYIAGSESTADNGVILRGTVSDLPTVTGTATVTVNQSSLFITLGTGNDIDNLDNTTYRKEWSVQVTDANSVPVANATLTIKGLPERYMVGQLVYVEPIGWVYDTGRGIYTCPNEDLDADGTLDPGEDRNGDGVLWPGNVISVTPATVQTDLTGRSKITLLYPESYAPWVQLRLTATAIVSGTESKRDAVFIVPGLGSDFANAAVPPAGVVSPFGTAPTPGAGCVPYLP